MPTGAPLALTEAPPAPTAAPKVPGREKGEQRLKARREEAEAAEARVKTTTPAANIRAPLNRRAQDRA